MGTLIRLLAARRRRQQHALIHAIIDRQPEASRLAVINRLLAEG